MRFVSCDFPGRVRSSVMFGCTAIKMLFIGCVLGFGAKANKMWFCSQNTVFDGLTILGKFASPDQKYVLA